MGTTPATPAGPAAGRAGGFPAAAMEGVAGPRLDRLVYLLALAALLGSLWLHLTGPVKDPDAYWHLATGKWIVENRALPATDPFSFPALAQNPPPGDAAWVRFMLRSYWLAQAGFYLVYEQYGFGGLVVLRATVLTVAMAVVAGWMFRRRIPPLLALPLIALCGPYLGLTPFKDIRPQMFTFVAIPLLVVLLEGVLRRRDAPPAGRGVQAGEVAIVLLMALWSNLHGGVVLGNVIVILYAAAEIASHRFAVRQGRTPQPVRRFLLLGLASVAASLANPETYHSALFLFALETSNYGAIITEYLPPWVLTTRYHQPLVPLWGCLALGGAVHLLRYRHIPLRRHLLFLFLGLIALKSYRYTVFVVLVEPLFLGSGLRGLGAAVRELLPRLARAAIAVPLLALPLTAYAVRGALQGHQLLKFNRAVLFQYPSGAVSFLRSHRVAGNCFNTYDWGGYLTWELYPEIRILYDGRSLIREVFDNAARVWEAAGSEAGHPPEWRAHLDRWGVDLIVMNGADLFDRAMHPLLPALIDDPDWALVYRAMDALIFVRRATYPELVAKSELAGALAYDQVIIQARLAIDLHPNTPEPWLLLGQGYLYRGSLREAWQSYRKALAINPNDAEARRMVATIEAAAAR